MQSRLFEPALAQKSASILARLSTTSNFPATLTIHPAIEPCVDTKLCTDLGVLHGCTILIDDILQDHETLLDSRPYPDHVSIDTVPCRASNLAKSLHPSNPTVFVTVLSSLTAMQFFHVIVSQTGLRPFHHSTTEVLSDSIISIHVLPHKKVSNLVLTTGPTSRLTPCQFPEPNDCRLTHMLLPTSPTAFCLFRFVYLPDGCTVASTFDSMLNFFQSHTGFHPNFVACIADSLVLRLSSPEQQLTGLPIPVYTCHFHNLPRPCGH